MGRLGESEGNEEASKCIRYQHADSVACRLFVFCGVVLTSGKCCGYLSSSGVNRAFPSFPCSLTAASHRPCLCITASISRTTIRVLKIPSISLFFEPFPESVHPPKRSVPYQASNLATGPISDYTYLPLIQHLTDQTVTVFISRIRSLSRHYTRCIVIAVQGHRIQLIIAQAFPCTVHTISASNFQNPLSHFLPLVIL